MITAPVIEAAPAAAAAAPATGATGANTAPGFDAILMLQNLAATADTLDAAAFEAGDTADLLAAEDGEDDDTDEDIEASLAFLSALLTATTPKESPGEFSADGQEQGGSAEADASAAPVKNATRESLDPGFALNAETPDSKSDALLTLAAMQPESKETRVAGDASQNLARAAELLANAQRPASAAALDRPAVATHARDPRWADDFGARVSLIVRGGESTASLAMTPLDLGPVEVNVTVKDSQATIHFGASQAETRALIEASLPRLRELLAAQGFNLTDASVSSGFSRSQQQQSSQGARAAGESETATTEARSVRSLGLLDLYA